jgi:hypothetical protein
MEPLIERLRASCVRVMGRRPGCGFPVAPGRLVTCAHVVGREIPPGRPIALHPWHHPAREATLERLHAGSDLALLSDPAAGAPVAEFGRELALDDPVLGIGFPVFDGRAELDQFTAEYEGETHARDLDSGGERRLLKLKAGQIERGFSGGPLLNRRTGRIVGVTRLSRDAGNDLGGWAIPVDEVLALCAAAGVPLPHVATPPTPAEPAPGTLERMRDLLLGLPGWERARRRHGFVAMALGRRHRVMGEVDWEGGARQLAWEVACACEDYPEPTPTGLSPLCALLAAIPREFGPQPERDPELAALRTLLRCPTPGRGRKHQE